MAVSVTASMEMGFNGCCFQHSGQNFLFYFCSPLIPCPGSDKALFICHSQQDLPDWKLGYLQTGCTLCQENVLKNISSLLRQYSL